MSPPFCTPFELASPPGPLEKTRCTCKSTHLPQENPSHPQQTHAHIHTNICMYIYTYIYLWYCIGIYIYTHIIYIIYTYIFYTYTTLTQPFYCVLAGSWPWNCSVSRISSGLCRVCRCRGEVSGHPWWWWVNTTHLLWICWGLPQTLVHSE